MTRRQSLAAVVTLVAALAPAAAHAARKTQDLTFTSHKGTIPAKLAPGARLSFEVVLRNRGNAVSRRPRLEVMLHCGAECTGQAADDSISTAFGGPHSVSFLPSKIGPSGGELGAVNLKPRTSKRVRVRATVPAALDGQPGTIIVCARESFRGEARAYAERTPGDNCRRLGRTHVGRSSKLTQAVEVDMSAKTFDTTMHAVLRFSFADFRFDHGRWVARAEAAPVEIVSSSWSMTRENCAVTSTSATGKPASEVSIRKGTLLPTAVELPVIAFAYRCGGSSFTRRLAVGGQLTNLSFGLDGGTLTRAFDRTALTYEGQTPAEGAATAKVSLLRGP